MALTQDEQGQISIFFSASLVVMITIVAFVINIGLFVKAKINLQNATDAAAFSGAAVQSRQLSKIAYLNWEMRNIYKEWLYKYYVIGNLNIKDVENPSGDGAMSFRLEPDIDVLKVGPDRIVNDAYNIPTVCIHIAGSQTNICKRYSVPGLPEFGSTDLPGASEASRVFMDTLISTKVNDCIDRTRLNMLVANTWTYNVLADDFDQSLSGRAPAILADRQGAWPRAVELAMRIRNLESIMNRPPVTNPICNTGSTTLTSCQESVTSLENELRLGNERTVKAFYSGYRNLGNETDNEMKNSFTLTEIPPKEYFRENDTNNSNLLLPATSAAKRKYFVDLKLMMANLAIFYAALIPRADDKTSGACDISKVALPVPGYPLGFYKNPDVLTYYAVRGEAEFVGMFNPFGQPVKLTAYAAAKPFGGRVGPMIFSQAEGDPAIRGRKDPFRSLPYLTSYDFIGTTIRNETYDDDTVKFIPGLPLPTNSTDDPGPFWIDETGNPIGGKINDPRAIQFGLPNLVYKYQQPFSKSGYTLQTEPIHRIRSAAPQSDDKAVGLFSKFQFREFKGTALTSNISPTTLDHEIARVRAPTDYEAANYLVPTPSQLNLLSGLDSFGFIDPQTPVETLDNGYVRYRASVYAPLYGTEPQDLVYRSPQDVQSAIFDFMRTQESGIQKYQMALNRAALNIWDRRRFISAGAVGSEPGYRRAASGVSDINLDDTSNLLQKPASCNSILGQFLHFYYGHPDLLPARFSPDDPAGCPKTLGALLTEYFSSTAQDPSYNPDFYSFDLSWKADQLNLDQGRTFLSAYTPGPFTGADPSGDFINEIPGGPGDRMQRNFYSTKFVTLDSLQTGRFDSYDNRQFLIFSEGDASDGTPEINQNSFANALDPDSVNADISTVKY